jgi:PAS domain S-box-containing protein
MSDSRGAFDGDRAEAGSIEDNRHLREEIARLREVEEALRWARQAADAVSEAMFRVDEGGRFLDVNRAACQMHGWSREELLGLRVRDIDAGSAGEWPDFWARLRGERRIVFEGVNRRRDGSTFPARIDASLLEHAGTEQCVGVVHDLTEQRRSDAAELERLQAQQALRQSEELLRNVIDNTKAVVFVKRADGRYLLVNREYERLVGVTNEQVRDKTDHDVLPAEVADMVRANDLEVLRSRESSQYEEVVPTLGGLRTYLAIKVPLLDPAGEPWAVCGISTDITERKDLELQMRQMQRLESVGLLAGGVAHDFNNLLTAIQGYTDLAMYELGPSHPTRALLAEVQGASRRAAGLTRQLLAFARRQEMAPRRVDLPGTIEDVNALLRPLIGERIQPVVRLEPDLWPVHFDPGQLEQVLVNLAVNARDAMPEGGTLAYEAGNARLGADELPAGSGLAPGDYVRLVVRDTGSGMTPEVVARIFEPFFTTKGPGKGTGIGLATCHGILRQSGGHIGVESEPGKGTAFQLLLPRSPEDALAPEVVRTGTIQQGRGTVMIVEDEPMVRSLAARSLREAGYAVIEAACGEDALARIAGGGPAIDLLLTDVIMPGMNGPELADRARAQCPGLAVLFTTGYAEEPLRERLRATGAMLIEKPYAPSALTVAVREAFTARR